MIDNGEYAQIAELAAQGILQEGKLLNKECDAREMAAQLRAAAPKGEEEICQCAVRLYSADSFLYGLLTASQRNKDTSKIDSEQRLYCGVTLTDEMIKEYNRALGQWIVWPSHVSASKKRTVAETFGNTVFIMRTTKESPKNRSDISRFSYYPREQEVLLDRFVFYGIQKIERDSASGKYIIYMDAVV